MKKTPKKADLVWLQQSNSASFHTKDGRPVDLAQSPAPLAPILYQSLT